MPTAAASLSVELRYRLLERVTSRSELAAAGFTRSTVTAQLDAGRWQRVGRAIVLHNGTLTTHENWLAVLQNCAAPAVLTSFTALQAAGLEGWERDEVHVLVPAGSRVGATPGIPVRVHEARVWPIEEIHPILRRHRVPAAAALAAASVPTPRVAAGVLAATVQQRLGRCADLVDAVTARPKLRHRRTLLSALDDIGMGTHALSEIDFARLCRRARLPLPQHQSVRADPHGRRRYLDAEWRSTSGRRLAVEVDGSLHTSVRRWWDDQLRQNLVVVSGTPVLRFPSIIVRTEEELVASLLRRGLRMIGIRPNR